jgi:glycogen debranching enzyme
VLYDQLLYLQAQRVLKAIHRYIHGVGDHYLDERVQHLRHQIRMNYWFDENNELPDGVYHEVLYRKGTRAAQRDQQRYWLPFFSPQGYGYRFDALANVLASLFGVADDHQRKRVNRYIAEEIADLDGASLLPAFHPVIQPLDEDWEHLQMTFSYSFKNKPHEYHNGGRWPFITGLYVAALAEQGDTETAGKFLQAVHEANALQMDGTKWSFPEYVHGQNGTAGGTLRQGWSAAGAIIGHHALKGKRLFRI